MDQKEALRILGDARADIAALTENGIYSVEVPGKAGALGIFFKLGRYQIILILMIGPKWGVEEECTIIDTRPQVCESNALVAIGRNLFLPELPTFVRAPEDFRVARKKMGSLEELETYLENLIEKTVLELKADEAKGWARISSFHHRYEKGDMMFRSIRPSKWTNTRT